MSPGRDHAPSESAPPSPAVTPGEAALWLISDSPAIVASIRGLLAPDKVSIRQMSLPAIEHEVYRPGMVSAPALMLLDIGEDVDRGCRIIRQLRRARLHTPVVVLTASLSRDFGAKIISEGIRYYFSHDYCREELLELVQSLLKKD
jgi:DNA-binding NarL/FixJ family response regulator